MEYGPQLAMHLRDVSTHRERGVASIAEGRGKSTSTRRWKGKLPVEIAGSDDRRGIGPQSRDGATEPGTVG